MRPESITRFREALELEELGRPVIAGMHLLIRAHEHLKKEPPAPENAAAMELIFSIIGTLEDESKALSEKRWERWGEVLAVDGLELSSPEILEELQRIRRGQNCIERATHHLRNRCPVDFTAEEELRAQAKAAGPNSAARTLLNAILRSRVRAKGDTEDEEALGTLADLLRQLDRGQADFEEAQRKYQWAMAEVLTGMPPGSPTKPV